ncbi:MAG: hypothetical protein LBH44_11520 [Treponema sp.]|jgi:hypothetical protein|nr:hypothetical protein [Treponema sp.]
MTITLTRKIIMICIPALFLSCEALPVNYSKSQSWLITEKTPEVDVTTFVLLGVQIDRNGGWDSIEREASSLVPLYFWNNRCKIASAGERPEYAAAIQLREREFSLGWRTKRSLSVEVRIWGYEDAAENDASLYQKLPVAAGRITAMGDRSFSSSETTGKLLSKAIKKAVKELVLYERQKNDA